jgi:DNA-binding NtrC family response regulator
LKRRSVQEFRECGLLGIVRALVQSLCNENAAQRVGAARAIEELARLSTPYNGGSVAAELDNAVEPLIAVLSDQNPDVKKAAFAALGCLASLKPTNVVKAIIDHPLRDFGPEMIMPALRTLQQCGADAASAAIGAITELLKYDNVEIRGEACRILGWLRQDGRTVVAALVDTVLHDTSADVSMEAVQSLLLNDDTLEILSEAVLDRSERERVLQLLRQVGPCGREARQHLQEVWLPVVRESPTTTPSVEDVDPQEVERLREIKGKVDPKDEYIGQSLPILRMFERIHLFNQTADKTGTPDKPVLLLGETGAGKTVLGKLIHRHSRRAGTLCEQHATAVAAQDEGIIRQNWVGYGKRSTVHGADPKGEDGIIQQHQGGTIFFDELHATPPRFQTFLLQVLDRSSIPRPHGVSNPVVPDVRLIFASNKTLHELDDEKLVQVDLLDRLRRWLILVPPLRDRKEDIIHFVEKWCEGHDRDHRFLLALIKYDWPGNVRELHDVLDLANSKIGSRPGKLTLDHLEIADPAVIEAVHRLDDAAAEREVYVFLIKTFENQGLRKGKGLLKRLAQFLGITEPTISKRLRPLGIDCKQCD